MKNLDNFELFTVKGFYWRMHTQSSLNFIEFKNKSYSSYLFTLVELEVLWLYKSIFGKFKKDANVQKGKKCLEQ